MEGDVRAAVAGAELLRLVDAAVAVRVAQGENLAEPRLGVNVAVWRDGDAAQALGGVAGLPADDEVVRYDERPEARRQRDCSVVRIRRREFCLRGAQSKAQRKNGEKQLVHGELRGC